MSIDLNPYGLGWILDPAGPVIPPDYSIATVVRNSSHVEFTKPNGEKVDIQLKDKKLGAGSFGETWAASTKLDGSETAVKIIKKQGSASTADFIKESIVQIVIYETSKELSYPELAFQGPFCPKLYLIGQDKDNYYIVIERMEATLLSLFLTPPKIINTIVRNTVIQLCTMLEVLYGRLQFNHRDLKPDNLMFTMIDGKFNLRLIDFGFACLNYNGLNIHPEAEYIKKIFDHCFIESRDLHALFHQFLNIYKLMLESDKSLEYDKTYPMIKVFKTLKYSGDEDEPKWRNTYKLYNMFNSDEDFKPKNLTLSIVKNVFLSLKFEWDYVGSNINPDWTQYLVFIDDTILADLTIDEIRFLPKRLLEEWVDTANIHKVVKIGTVEMLQAILDKYPERINSKNINGQTPLMIICSSFNRKKQKLFKTILDFPYTKTALKDEKGNTALHYATTNMKGYLRDIDREVINSLLKKNPALADIKNNLGKGPGNLDIVTQDVHNIIKKKKSTFFHKNPNTNKARKTRKRNRL